MSSRIGVDIGGTFTDLVYYDDETGEVVVGKVPTTPSSPERGCIAAVEEVVPAAVLSRSSYFLHGTTVGLNALLERRGAKVALLCTDGFRDVLEIGSGSRDTYDLFWQPPPPLVPRDLRLTVRQRMAWDGSVVTPLVDDDVRAACATLREAGVDGVAVVYLHAYANPEHELRTEALLRECGFAGAISLSHRVSGEYRDFERASTTTIDAFVRHRMSGYIRHIDAALRGLGFPGTCLMTRSGSGSMTFHEALERPFETINSGPVAGAEGAAEFARRFGLERLITADVGGTSFDTCLVMGGRPQLLHRGTVAGLPVQTSWVDVRSIGAGGGSIARVDAGGLLVVGPQSAGAEPGPACYSRGGMLPTVTDAAFHLGMLGDGALASGLHLDATRAADALAPLAKALDYTIEQAARGIVVIVGSSMANTIRELTIEQGVDPREFTLLAFGGAGPMMGTQLARELGLRDVLVPPHAGNFSAWGLLGADLLRSRARTRVMPLDDASLEIANGVVRELLASMDDGGSGIGATLDDRTEIALDMRFDGQEHTLTIEPEHRHDRIVSTVADLAERFREAYRRSFGLALSDRIQLVSIRVARRRPLPRRSEKIAYPPAREIAPTIEAFSFARDRRCTFAARHRGSLEPGVRHAGPAIVYEPTTTTYVDADFSYGVDAHGNLLLRREE